MSVIADEITAAANSINASVAAIQANGIVDPTIPPAVATLQTAASSLSALATPAPAPADAAAPATGS